MRLLTIVVLQKERCSARANNSPAPTDRRRLPVNKDIVGKRDFALYDGAKKLLYKAGCRRHRRYPIIALMANMRPTRDLCMMIRCILNVNVFYSK